tara:strand:+ start:1066 stop:2559 length:1494 start_codon:yes stop_codon:yes gene_type:complete
MVKKFFWADAIADKIIKERGDKKEYVCASGITPSGQIHIGNFREVITTNMVVKALQDKGKKVRFIYSWDDFDRFRKVPKGINKNYKKYLGMPLSDIPSPFLDSVSYAEYFEKRFENSLKKLNIEPEYIYQNKMNKKSVYSELIKTTLDKKDQIKEILNKFRKEPLEKNWWPIMVYCGKCNTDKTSIIKTNGYKISYKCKCNFEETFDIRKKGIVSIRWRIDWPLRWKYEDVDFEPGGIDHSVYGGSFTTAKEISKKIFDFEPPIYQFYEWMNIKGGSAFSSSLGNVITLDELAEIYEPEVLRFLFVNTKPKSAFQISFDNDVIKIYEDFDTLEKKYYQKKLDLKEKRVYEFSQLKIPKVKPERIGFRHLIALVQVGDLGKLNNHGIRRAEKVKNWLKKYAGKDMKFEFQKKAHGSFNSKERESLLELKKLLRKKKFEDEKELLGEFYEICKKLELKNTEFFTAAYKVIINQKKGPRLTSLIKIVGQKKIIKLLDTLK